MRKPLTVIRRARKSIFVQEKCKAAGKWLTVLSLCAGLGLHWAALQSVAWAGMLVSYARTGSVATAITKTFDGKHPCPLCKAIAKGEQGRKKQDFQPGNVKIDMDIRTQAALLYPPSERGKRRGVSENALAFFVQPPVPPPRFA